MAQCVSELLVGPAAQARNILDAWVRQDNVALRQEFERGLDLYRAPAKNAAEEENRELLQAVMAKLSGVPVTSQVDHDDPGVRLCISLLEHLASRS